MTAEQYQRWHIRDCARCGRRAAKAANWPDGPICRTCFAKATEVRGRCPGCSTDRLLPGRRPDGTAVCRDCAGITRNFFCDRCSLEGYCNSDGSVAVARCPTSSSAPSTTAADRSAPRSRSPGISRHAAAKDRLDVAAPHPRPGLLAGLARGRIALTHEALRQLPNWRTVAYLRDLLMSCGGSPPSISSCSMPRPGCTTASASAPALSTSCCSAALAYGTRSRACAPGACPAAHSCQSPLRRRAIHPGRSGSWGWLTNVAVSLRPAPRPTSTPGTPGIATTGPRGSVLPGLGHGQRPLAATELAQAPGPLSSTHHPSPPAGALARVLTDERPALRSLSLPAWSCSTLSPSAASSV